MNTTTKERPILFSGQMVSAILDGRKTQTRRIITPQPEHNTDCPYHVGYGADRKARVCPFGKPGDRLWVRETWCELDKQSGHWWDITKPKDAMILTNTPYPRRNAIAYRAECDADSERCRIELGYKWRPSIHMPRWASRITLEITRVRVERVQEIIAVDCIDEGINPVGTDPCDIADSARDYFRDLWDSINASRGYGWSVNPWVWCLDFKRVEVADVA